jgi:ABC-type branched-subunit amino acid transport system ATPase component/ABC-type branched-subunit amino acid transport system permease subunit
MTASPRLGLLSGPDVRLAQWAAAGMLAFLIFTRVLFPAPPGILALGAVLGALSALTAMGLVLVYRANRIINFAQGELGAVAAVLAVLLMGGGWPFFPAIAAGLVVAILIGGIVEFAFVRRFSRAPRLILTVATIGVSQLLAGLALTMPHFFGKVLPPQDFPTPIEFSFSWAPVSFQGAHLFAVVVVAASCGALTLFFRLTRTGVAIRGAAASAERAEQLGIPVRRLNLLVWILAAGLSAAAALLRAPIVGVAVGQVLGPGLLLRALAAAVIGRMESLPVTFAAAVGLGMAEQAVYWSTGRSGVTDVVIFLLIVAVLLVQRTGNRSRAEDTGVSTFTAIREVRPVPPELAHLPEVRWGLRIPVVVVALALVLAPAVITPSRVNLLGSGVLIAIVGISLVILMGWAGEISLGQMAFFGFGAATAGRLALLGWNFFACVALAGLVGAVVAVVIGLPALRIRGPLLAVTTFAFALATSAYLLNPEFVRWFVKLDRISRPVLFGRIDLESESSYYYVLLIVFALVLLSVRSLRSSRTGRALLALRENVRGAQAFGLNSLRLKLVAFAFSGFFAALAGGLFAFHQHAIGQTAFNPQQSIRIFSMVVFGGLGSVSGVIAGAVYFTSLDYFVKLPQTQLLLSGFGLLFVLLVLPGGLGQVLYSARDKFLRQVARAKEINVPSLVTTPAAVPAGDVKAAPPRVRPSGDGGEAPPRGLVVQGLEVSYGHAQVLFGIDLVVRPGEIVALLGNNGAGKTTLLRAIAGSVRPGAGTVLLDGRDITDLDAARTAAAGVVIVPGGKGVFPELTVAENLQLAGWLFAKDPATLAAATDRVVEYFPVLGRRLAQKAGDLSGGEQQMLTLAQGFIAQPSILMIDELSLGLAPAIVDELLEIVRAIHREGIAVLLVEQSANTALTVAERALFLEKGEVRFEGRPAALLEEPDILRAVFLEGASSVAGNGQGGAASAAAPAKRRYVAHCDACEHERAVVLSVEGVSKDFGGIKAVNEVTFDLRDGQILGLMGPNGAGKTTIFDLISGFLAPDAGTVTFQGFDVTGWGPDTRAGLGLGRSFQDSRLFPALTVRDTVAVALERHIATRDPLAAALVSPATKRTELAVGDRVDELIESLRLQPYANRYVSEVSTGVRRLVDLACILGHDPSVLLLDEPSSGIAQKETEGLGELLLDVRNRTGAALLVIEHDMPLLNAISDEIVALDLGTVVTRDVPENVMHHPQVVLSYLGTSTSLLDAAAGPKKRRTRPLRAATL